MDENSGAEIQVPGWCVMSGCIEVVGGGDCKHLMETMRLISE